MADLSSSPIKSSAITYTSPIDASVSPRPASPAEEADEALTPTEDDEYKKAGPQNRRKSSVWKRALNIKKQISKIKITDGVRRPSIFFSQADETNLSPVEISPESVEENAAKSEYVQHLENEIIQSMNDLEMAMELHRSEDNRPADIQTECEQDECPSVEPKALAINRAHDECGPTDAIVRVTSQPRPMNLPLFDENEQPIVPPRAHKSEMRNQRLLSVPNIKYNRATGEFPKSRVKKDSTTSFAGNFMKKFSKYWMQSDIQNQILHTTIKLIRSFSITVAPHERPDGPDRLVREFAISEFAIPSLCLLVHQSTVASGPSHSCDLLSIVILCVHFVNCLLFTD